MPDPLKMLDSYPTDDAIANYIYNNRTQIRMDTQDCEGTLLWRDGKNHVGIWLEAMVDLDTEYHYLVQVTSYVNEPRSYTQHYLYIGYGLNFKSGLIYETMNEVVDLYESFGDYKRNLSRGLHWFADKVVENV